MKIETSTSDNLAVNKRLATRLAFACAGLIIILSVVGLFIWAGVIDSFAYLFVICAIFILSLILWFFAYLLCKKLDNSKVVRGITSAFVIVISGCVALSMLVWIIQDNFLFYNVSDEASRAYLADKQHYSEVSFTAGNGKTYYGVLYNAAGDGATGAGANTDENRAAGAEANVTADTPLIIYFGGNGEVSHRFMRNAEESGRWAILDGYSFLYIDYEGYGLNGGKAQYQNMYDEALAVYDYAVGLPHIDASRVVAMGYSLGTSPAVYLAANRDVCGLILEAPYANGTDIYNAMLPIFYGPGELLVKQKLPSEKYAPLVSCKTLVIASRADEAVPFESSERLSSLFAGSVEFVTLENIDHNGIVGARSANQSIAKFLSGLNETAWD